MDFVEKIILLAIVIIVCALSYGYGVSIAASKACVAADGVYVDNKCLDVREVEL